MVQGEDEVKAIGYPLSDSEHAESASTIGIVNAWNDIACYLKPCGLGWKVTNVDNGGRYVHSLSEDSSGVLFPGVHDTRCDNPTECTFFLRLCQSLTLLLF